MEKFSERSDVKEVVEKFFRNYSEEGFDSFVGRENRNETDVDTAITSYHIWDANEALLYFQMCVDSAYLGVESNSTVIGRVDTPMLSLINPSREVEFSIMPMRNEWTGTTPQRVMNLRVTK